jgi:hypothetical protein
MVALSTLEILHCLFKGFLILPEIMPMDKTIRLGIVNMGDIFSLEIPVKNHGKMGIVGMAGVGAFGDWFVEHAFILD